MRILLEIQNGPGAGRIIELRPGQINQVGRSGWVDLIVPEDPTLGDIHFLLESRGSSCAVRDLNGPGGTYHNGVRVAWAALSDGDRIGAGRSTFAVRFAADAPVVPVTDGATPEVSPTDRLLQILRGLDEPLFALLDAARDLAVLAHLYNSQEEFQSLYEGPQGEELALFAPYLVHLPASCPLLEVIVDQGWGRNWGIFLTSHRPFSEIRKHFRRFLIVQTQEGERLYFRFYDPRVLRDFLPSCTQQEIHEFFDPVEAYLTEGDDPQTLLWFAPSDNGQQLRPRDILLAAKVPGQPEAAREGRS
jgi:hypothetical protein